MAAARQRPTAEFPTGRETLRFRLHRVDVLRSGEAARPHLLRIGTHGGLDRRSELAIALDEFRHPRRQSQHILQHQNLSVARGTSPDTDGWDRYRLGDAAPQRL